VYNTPYIVYEVHSVRTNIELDDALVDEAFQLTNVRTKRELVDLALRELIKTRKRKDLISLAGQIRLRDDYDHKTLRTTRG
tara:strand:- start:1608 stop:1850 length:243 start_codon:yes stop_codon:yes gene_type:complete